MPEFDSLSFALLIPFAICFILVFIVCCFADEIKDICRMPSPLPSSYLGVDRSRSSRRNNRRQGRVGQPQNEEIRNLILSEEGRIRNASESSTDTNHVNAMLANSNISIVRQPGARLQPNIMVLPQTSLSAARSGSQTVLQPGSQIFRIPSTNCVVSRPSVHTSIPAQGSQRIIIQPLGHFATRNANKSNSNLNRNLAMHASTSHKDFVSSLKPNEPSCECASNTNKGQSSNNTELAPRVLDNYLANGSSFNTQTPLSTKQRSDDSRNDGLS